MFHIWCCTVVVRFIMHANAANLQPEYEYGRTRIIRIYSSCKLISLVDLNSYCSVICSHIYIGISTLVQ